jgi:hypothetical protein
MFRRKVEPSAPTTPTNYPHGLFVVTEEGYYIIRTDGRLRLKSVRMAVSWNTKFILSTEAAVKHLPVTGHAGFRDGTMIRNQADKKDYLISQGLKRHILSPDVFERYGLSERDIITVSNDEAEFHKDGEVLN